jgi:hypothetical protein
MVKDASDQAVDFFIKRAEITRETAYRHCKDAEYEKGIKLYKQAYGFFLKAQQKRPDDSELQEKIKHLKLAYQEAKQNAAKQT